LVADKIKERKRNDVGHRSMKVEEKKKKENVGDYC
jgi:hypothetical protein